MIARLAPGDAARVRPLFRGLDQHLAVRAMLAGETPAEIFADDPRDPQAALLLPWHRRRIYLAGDAGNQRFNQALAGLLARQLRPQDAAPAPVDLIVYYAPAAWEQTVAAIMPGATTIKALRHCYRLRELQVDWRRLIPAELTMRRVDWALLADRRLQNLDQLIAEIHSESHSIDDFLDNKLGFCVQQGHALIGWCLSEYNYGARCELGVETPAGERRRGIATLAAAATIEQAHALNITDIGWHCWADNLASIALARKLGFEQVDEYTVQRCRW